ncbi:MAG: 16S rRNA (cytosine(967)-C(5))-methyltransferase RsmB [Calditrichaeota bacterium]|nr:MAG: 16S rRNA (cytosine(967)-C(5))-methyltransferase RsmB [Calditrichota bacterium]
MRNQKQSARAVANHILQRIEADGAYSDIVLSHTLEQHTLPERDRALVSELVRGCVRWKMHLDWIVQQLFQGEISKMPLDVRILLWQALYQLKIMKTPEYAVVNEYVRLVKELQRFAWTGVVNGLLRNYIRHAQEISLPDPISHPIEHVALATSHPEWLVSRWQQQFGDEITRQVCEANNRVPALSARVNQTQISVDDFCAVLDMQQTRYERSLLPGFVRILDVKDELRWTLLAEGKMTIQDESAGLVTFLAEPQSGEIVVDLCAAPGGKTTHLAEAAPGCIVMSGDIHRRRTRLIRVAEERLKLGNIYIVTADALNFPVVKANCVLLDAPCSGLGLLRKKPEIRWQRREQDIAELIALQKKLLRRAAEYVAPGGRLIYSTCTIDQEENEQVVFDFCANSDFMIAPADLNQIPPEFVTRDGFIRTWPHLHNMDGAFAAKLKKRNIV